MPFTFEENVLLKFLGKKRDGALNEFVPNFGKKWAVSSVTIFYEKIDKTGSVERKVGSGRPWSIRTQRNISRANALICSQEDNPGTSKNLREIQKVTSISRAFCHCVSSVTVVL